MLPLDDRIDAPEVKELSDSPSSLFPSLFESLGGTKSSNSASESSKLSSLQQTPKISDYLTTKWVLLRHVFYDLLEERSKHVDEDKVLKRIDLSQVA